MIGAILPKRVLWKLTTWWGLRAIRRRGGKIGHGVRLNGLPRLNGSGRVVLGNRVALVSDWRGTALGTRAPVLLNTLTPDAEIEIGDDTGISGGIIVAGKHIKIGARCLLGADVMVFDNDFHPLAPEGRRYARPDFDEISTPTVIGDDVFVGTRTTVTKGAQIGDGSVIAAGSVVVGVIPPGVIAGGVPAKVIRAL